MANVDWFSLLLLLSTFHRHASAVDFLFNSFSAADDLILINDAQLDTASVRLVNDSNRFSFGRAFYSTKLPMKSPPNRLSSFSTSFIFSVTAELDTAPGFGLCFVLSNSTSPPGALASQYFGLFTNATFPPVSPLLVVEFDTGQNPEFNDPDGNHIGIDLNNIESVETAPGGYYDSDDYRSFVPVNMRSGRNVRAWIDFRGADFEINVSVTPVGVSKPSIATLNYRNPLIANYVSSEMFVGFSASKTQWIETQRVLAWSLSDTGGAAREINITGLPDFTLRTRDRSLSAGAIAGIVIGCVVSVAILGIGGFWFWRKKFEKNEDEIEDWEMEYWPHRFSYEELVEATDGLADKNLLGSGGFGQVYKGILAKNTEIAVKSVSRESKQGLREFMAEISSMGRLQHKNLVQMRGWCRKSNYLLIVYDYMPNGSLNSWIFDNPQKLLGWKERRRVLGDVAEGLYYLHNGWDQVVVHRDIKSSNILLDSDMRGRLGDFGLAKLYQHGEVPNSTRVVGTLGYLAPELTTMAVPMAPSDVYSFGVVILEVACGRRPIELAIAEEDDILLIGWVREMFREGRLIEAADPRIAGEYEIGEMEMVLKLGLACCNPDPTRRPTMKEVVALLVGEEAIATAPAQVLSNLASGSGNGSDEATNEALPPLEPPV